MSAIELWDASLEQLATAVLEMGVRDALAPSHWKRPRARARAWLAAPPEQPYGPYFWCQVAGIRPQQFYKTLADILEPRNA